MTHMQNAKLSKFQKCSEGFFKELKLIKGDTIDKDAFLKYVEVQIKEELWKPFTKVVIEKCFDKVSSDFAKIAAALGAEPFNIKKEECSVFYLSMNNCMFNQGIMVGYR